MEGFTGFLRCRAVFFTTKSGFHGLQATQSGECSWDFMGFRDKELFFNAGNGRFD